MFKKCMIFIIIFFSLSSNCSEQQNKEIKNNLIKKYALNFGGTVFQLSGTVIGLNGLKGIIWPKKGYLCLNGQILPTLAFYENSALIFRARSCIQFLLGATLYGTGQYVKRK